MRVDCVKTATDRIRGLWPGEVQAVNEICTAELSRREFGAGLNALCNRSEAKVVGERDDARNEVRPLLVLAHSVEEDSVDLDLVNREVVQVTERRVPGPKVIDREMHAQFNEFI